MLATGLEHGFMIRGYSKLFAVDPLVIIYLQKVIWLHTWNRSWNVVGDKVIIPCVSDLASDAI